MNGSPTPPSRLYVVAAIVIAVVIWLVLGAPGGDPAHGPFEVARSGFVRR